MRHLLLLAFTLSVAAGCDRSPKPKDNGHQRVPPSGIHFTDVTTRLGIDYLFAHGGQSPLNILELTTGGGAAFLDFDGDGWLDVLCMNRPHPVLFRSEKGERFVDVTRSAGIRCPEARWGGCAVGDYDNDGHPDLFLTAYNRTALFRNNGDGTFADVTAATGVQLSGWCTSAAFADVDRDGFLDLYVGRYVRFEPGMPEFSTDRGVKLSLGPEVYEPQRGVLFRSESGKRFRNVTATAGVANAQGKALGVAFGDPEGRGRDDLFVANDGMMQDYFENDGRGRFRSVSERNGTAFDSEGSPQGGMGVDFGDYDNDGKLDLFLANFADEPKSLYHAVGGGIFEHASTLAGLDQPTRRWVAFGTKFLDADNDGILDLAIVNGHAQDTIQKVDPGNSYPQPSQFFRGLGGGRFQDLSDAVGADFRKRIVGRALATGDFDNDGRVDLLAGVIEGPPLLLRNESPATGNWLTLHLTGTRSNRMAIGARVEVTAGGVRQVREVRTDGSYHAAHDPRVHFGIGKAEEYRVTIRWPSGRRQELSELQPNQIVKVLEP